MVNITNAWVDAFLGDIPVDFFGPGTRVTNVQSPQLTDYDDFNFTVGHGYGGLSTVTLNYNELIDLDAAKPIIFAAVIDDICAAYTTPYGPLTRVTEIEDLPVRDGFADEHVELSLASPYSTTFFITYQQMKHASILAEYVKRAAGQQQFGDDLIDAIDDLNTYASSLTAPYTVDELNELQDRYTRLSMRFGHNPRL